MLSTALKIRPCILIVRDGWGENPDPKWLKTLGISNEDLKKNPVYKGRGCSKCNNTGYKGRIGIFEMVELNNEVRELAFVKAPTREIRKACRASGMRTLMEDGKIKVFRSTTTPQEVALTARTEEDLAMA